MILTDFGTLMNNSWLPNYFLGLEVLKLCLAELKMRVQDNDPESYHDHQGKFENPSKAVLVKTAKPLMSRLFGNINHEESGSAIQEPSTSDTDSENLKSKLEKAISFSNSTPTKAPDHEFNLYENTGKLTPNLASLLAALKTIKPSSVESERVFSTVNQFVTKIRSRLSDKSVNALVFLKAYYKPLKPAKL